ncbi:MAG: type II toxin-antitoxin system RelE/ParE family toxin [Deltaproteobacteria bacterium]|nr:type II toxin-antitoxin system RelE/ParE family toxin [Deltaproteobacteria bacterium]
MSYSVELTGRAEREVLALDDTMFSRVSAAIDGFVDNPRPPGVRKLKGRKNDWRIRVGNFRVVYSIDDDAHIVLIHRVTDRKDVYRSV